MSGIPSLDTEGGAVPQGHAWPESHAEETDIFPTVSATRAETQSEATEEYPVEELSPVTPEPRSFRRAGIISGTILGVLAVLYGVDLLASQGNVPRGTTVAGVAVGGLSQTTAEQKLRDTIGPRLIQPLQIKAGDVRDAINPAAAGLNLDWSSTLDQAGSQPLNPVTRIASFFSDREVGVVTQADKGKLASTLETLRTKVDRVPIEGTVTFKNTQPALVEPKQGQRLQSQGAAQVVLADWASGKILDLPVAITAVKATPEAVHLAFDQIAKPAVSGPVTIHAEGKDVKLDPKTIASVLTFEPGDGGILNPKIDQAKIIEVLGPQVKSTEKEGKDATVVFASGKPTVEPSVEGKTVDWEKTLLPLVDVLKQSDKRELPALYTVTPAKVTTEQAEALGIKEVISEFSTGGFAADSGTNIRVVAEKVNGAIVKPGETFSLNGFTGPRGTAQGYVEAGVIENGAPAREVGGGISQFATTLYNASYFAGMKDAGHKEHSYYISRYPAAREATVFQNHSGGSVIDLKFTNDGQTGVAIQAIWTPTQLTVKLWGTKKYTIESVPGARTNPTDPQEKPGPAENCHASNGAPGFTASDTRIVRDAGNGREIRRDHRTVRYNPQPKIICAAP